MSDLNEIMGMVTQYSEFIRDMVHALKDGITALHEFRGGEAAKYFSLVTKHDTEGDRLRKRIIERIGIAEIPSRIRDFLLFLLRRLDGVADFTKESARFLSIIPFLELPAEIREGIERLSKVSIEAVNTLYSSIKMLSKGNYELAIKYSFRVEELEEEADKVTMKCRRLIIKYGRSIANPGLLIITGDFIEALESISDQAEDAADIIKALALLKPQGSK